MPRVFQSVQKTIALVLLPLLFFSGCAQLPVILGPEQPKIDRASFWETLSLWARCGTGDQHFYRTRETGRVLPPPPQKGHELMAALSCISADKIVVSFAHVPTLNGNADFAKFDPALSFRFTNQKALQLSLVSNGKPSHSWTGAAVKGGSIHFADETGAVQRQARFVNTGDRMVLELAERGQGSPQLTVIFGP